MTHDITISELLNMAVSREQDSYFFYMDLRDIVVDPDVKDTLAWIGEEEKRHRKFLVDYRSGKFGFKSMRLSDVVDFRIAENVKEPEITHEIDSAEVFLIASRRELNAYRFYMDLSGIASQEEIRKMLLQMAGEELRHKEKMEYLYTNTAFPQTSGG